MLEYLYIIFGSIAASLKLVDVIKRSHKSYEFTGNNPIKIAIFNFFIVFIFFVIKLLEIVPSKFYGEFEALQAVLYGTRI